MSKVSNYNELFADLQKNCNEENVFNAFSYISLDELKELNFLLDRLIIFCDNIDEEELEDYECGTEVLKLGQLADALFTRTSRNED